MTEWYYYKMEGAGKETLRHASDVRVSSYLQQHGAGQSLYIPAPCWAPNTDACWSYNRTWSSTGFVIRTMANRMMRVRSTWSRR